MKSQQNFKRKANNAFTEKVNEIALSVSDGKRIQIYYGIFSYQSLQSRADRKSKADNLNIMINLDDVTGENRQEHNPHWLQIVGNL